MPKVRITWTAIYETVVDVPDMSEQSVIIAASDLEVDVPGSEYQTDSFRVAAFREVSK